MNFSKSRVYYDTEAFAYFYFSPRKLDHNLHPANVENAFISPHVKAEFFNQMFSKNNWDKWVENPEEHDTLGIWRQYDTVKHFWNDANVSTKTISQKQNAINGLYFEELGEEAEKQDIGQTDVLHICYANCIDADVLVTFDSGYKSHKHRKDIDNVLQSLDKLLICNYDPRSNELATDDLMII